MRAWRCDYGGGLSSLRQEDVATPEPGPHQVLVRVRAVSLNRRELFILKGTYPLPVAPTLTPCCDGAGEVARVGSSVTTLEPGDRVIGAVFPRWQSGPFSTEVMDQIGGSLDGTLAEYICLDEVAAVKVPDDVPYAQAASLPCAGVTAWHALHADAALDPGSSVLSLTSGMVSVYAIRIASAMGLSTIAATASLSRADKLRAQGATSVVPTGPEMPARVAELTEGRGVDLVVHNYGSVDTSVQAARVAGQVSLVTVTNSGQLDLPAAFARNVTVKPISLGTVADTRALTAFASRNNIEVPIAKRFGFEEADAAFHFYDSQSPFGKVVISNAE